MGDVARGNVSKQQFQADYDAALKADPAPVRELETFLRDAKVKMQAKKNREHVADLLRHKPWEEVKESLERNGAKYLILARDELAYPLTSFSSDGGEFLVMINDGIVIYIQAT